MKHHAAFMDAFDVVAFFHFFHTLNQWSGICSLSIYGVVQRSPRFAPVGLCASSQTPRRFPALKTSLSRGKKKAMAPYVVEIEPTGAARQLRAKQWKVATYTAVFAILMLLLCVWTGFPTISVFPILLLMGAAVFALAAPRMAQKAVDNTTYTITDTHIVKDHGLRFMSKRLPLEQVTEVQIRGTGSGCGAAESKYLKIDTVASLRGHSSAMVLRAPRDPERVREVIFEKKLALLEGQRRYYTATPVVRVVAVPLTPQARSANVSANVHATANATTAAQDADANQKEIERLRQRLAELERQSSTTQRPLDHPPYVAMSDIPL